MPTVKSITDIQNDIIASVYENADEEISGQGLQDRMRDMAVSYINRLTDKVYLNLQEFSTSRAYEVGEGTIYLGVIYQCDTAHSAGAWNASNFTAISAGTGISGLTAGYIAVATSATTIGNSFIQYNGTRYVTTKSFDTSESYWINGYSILDTVLNNTNNALGFTALAVLASGNYNNSIGYYSLGTLTSGNNNVAIGDYAGVDLVTGSSNVFIGNDTFALTSSISHSIALGSGADLSEDNQMVVGGDYSGGGIKKAWFGQGVSNVVARLFGIEYHTTSVSTGISNGSAATSNTAYYAARGTGTGAGGHFQWWVAPAGSSGSTQNSYLKVLEIEDTGNIAFSNLTATTVPYLDGSKYLKSSAVTPTELGYLSGVTSGIQSQLNALTSGLSWKQAVRVATTIAGTLASSFENGDTVDGIVLVTGDRILIKDQTSATENGIYTVNASGAPTRSTDMDSSAEFPSATVAISEGTVNADKQYVCTNDLPITIGVTNITWVLVGGTTYVGTTNRVTVTGNVIDISATFEALLGKVANPLSQFASTTSSQLASIISDETGSGALVFGTAPIFTTNITSPKIIGGSANTSKIDFVASTNASVTAGIALQFYAGNNGTSSKAVLLHSGYWGLGSVTAPETWLHVSGAYVASRGQLCIQGTGGTGANAYPTVSMTDSAGARVGLFGFAGYGGADSHFYFANELNGSWIFKNNSVTVSTMTTNGYLSLGSVSAPTAGLDIYKTTEQIRIGYDTSYYWKATTSSVGLTTFDTGSAGTQSFAFAKDVSFTGKAIANSIIRLKAYTVGTLPTGTQGDTAFVTDALAPTFLATVVGGGAIATPVFYNGTNWVAQ
jgi:hypothetical protein